MFGFQSVTNRDDDFAWSTECKVFIFKLEFVGKFRTISDSFDPCLDHLMLELSELVQKECPVSKLTSIPSHVKVKMVPTLWIPSGDPNVFRRAMNPDYTFKDVFRNGTVSFPSIALLSISETAQFLRCWSNQDHVRTACAYSIRLQCKISNLSAQTTVLVNGTKKLWELYKQIQDGILELSLQTAMSFNESAWNLQRTCVAIGIELGTLPNQMEMFDMEMSNHLAVSAIERVRLYDVKLAQDVCVTKKPCVTGSWMDYNLLLKQISKDSLEAAKIHFVDHTKKMMQKLGMIVDLLSANPDKQKVYKKKIVKASTVMSSVEPLPEELMRYLQRDVPEAILQKYDTIRLYKCIFKE